MVLGRGFESLLHLKIKRKDGPLDGRKRNKKSRQPNGASHTKKNIKRIDSRDFADPLDRATQIF